jgi:hypothetical protein
MEAHLGKGCQTSGNPAPVIFLVIQPIKDTSGNSGKSLATRQPQTTDLGVRGSTPLGRANLSRTKGLQLKWRGSCPYYVRGKRSPYRSAPPPTVAAGQAAARNPREARCRPGAGRALPRPRAPARDGRGLDRHDGGAGKMADLEDVAMKITVVLAGNGTFSIDPRAIADFYWQLVEALREREQQQPGTKPTPRSR